MAPKNEYVPYATDDPRIYLLGVKGGKIPKLSRRGLRALRRATAPARWLQRARQRERAAKARAARTKQQILGELPRAYLSGFISRFGKMWLRVLVVPLRSRDEVIDPTGFVDYAGENLPRVADRIAISMSTKRYLQLCNLVGCKPPDGADWAIDSVEADFSRLERLIKRDQLPAVPDGLLKRGEPMDPRIDVDMVDKPDV